MNWCSVLFLLGLAALTPAVAQPRGGPEARLRRIALPGEGREMIGRLAGADRLAAQKSWAEALDEYQRLIREAGDDLVPEDTPRDRMASTRRSTQLRRLCHLRLAALPPEGLKRYRERVDAQARRWLQTGIDARDELALRRVVDEAFSSRSGEQALERLGDLAFERGDFSGARRWWRLIALLASEANARAPGTLLFPDPVSVPRVRARQVIALLLGGEPDRARAELAAFRRLHGTAEGQLAGKSGRYAEIVQGLIDLRKDGPLSPDEDDWPTFAGSPSRNRVVQSELPARLWADGPSWRVPLAHTPAEEVPPAERRDARRLAFHPVIAGGRVLVADARFVTAYDLRSGRRLFQYDLDGDRGRRGVSGLQLGLPAVPDLRYTLSVAEDRVYARLGAQFIGPLAKDDSGAGHSYLVCLDLTAGQAGKGGQGRERWVVRAQGEAKQHAVFEGAPLFHDGRVYAAESRPGVGRTRTAMVCLDAATGRLRWRQDVCDVPDAEDGPPPRARHHLLTLAGGALVYCSHSGVVAAVDVRTGKRLWSVRYPSREVAAARDLAPCVAFGGRVFVAPADSDRLFCLDAETGRSLWEREGVVPTHLLGVSGGRLIFTTARGLRAVDATTGGDSAGWTQPAVGRLGHFGRGLLIGGWVLWPTRDVRLPLRALNQEDGSPQRGPIALDPTRLRHLPPGNLAYGHGCLAIAGLDELALYGLPNPKRRQR